jgi:tRNA (guanine37-N1)-methyltransferase
MLTIDIITIFPQLFDNITSYGVIKEGESKNICRINIHNLRDYTVDKHKKVDDRPYGGGPGMVMTVQPIYDAVFHIKQINKFEDLDLQKVILLTPRGKRLNQKILRDLSIMKNLILICGRYEGVDERVRELVVDMEISIGDYVLTGGEIPAMVMIDGVIRLLDGIVGKEESLVEESFEKNIIYFTKYKRPEEYKGLKVPTILTTGNHAAIKSWRIERSIEMTRKKRPDLFDKKG